MNQIEWLLEKRIILYRPMGQQTLESLNDSMEQMTAMMEDGIAPVHIITDSRHAGRIPANINTLRNLKAFQRNERGGYSVTIGANPSIKFVSKVLTSLITDNPHEFRNTIDEAIKFLQVVDKTLPAEIDTSLVKETVVE